MLRAVPKPVKKEKPKKKGIFSNGRVIQDFNKKPKKSKTPQRYRTSEGELVTQGQIDSRLSKSYSENPQPHEVMCECCGLERATDHDHSISQRTCKILKIADFIWNPLNWSFSCRNCHTNEWESYKSGKFTKHKNFIKRMLVVKTFDSEGFRKRMNYVPNKEHIKQLTDENNN